MIETLILSYSSTIEVMLGTRLKRAELLLDCGAGLFLEHSLGEVNGRSLMND